MPNRLIGVGGYAKAGKDAFTDFLVNDHGWKRTYMSKALETALLKLNPWVDVDRDNWVRRTWPRGRLSTQYMRYRELHAIVGYADSKNCHDVRSYLQTLGTEIGRDMCDPDVWVRWAFNDIDSMLKDGHDVSLTGVRFWNEYQAVVDRGGLLVWIDRPGYGPVNSHASDNTLEAKDFDIVVRNAGTLEDLANEARRLHLSAEQ